MFELKVACVALREGEYFPGAEEHCKAAAEQGRHSQRLLGRSIVAVLAEKTL